MLAVSGASRLSEYDGGPSAAYGGAGLSWDGGGVSASAAGVRRAGYALRSTGGVWREGRIVDVHRRLASKGGTRVRGEHARGWMADLWLSVDCILAYMGDVGPGCRGCRTELLWRRRCVVALESWRRARSRHRGCPKSLIPLASTAAPTTASSKCSEHATHQ
jgi:hypothetical protein